MEVGRQQGVMFCTYVLNIMQTTDVEIAVVHDDEWCSTPVPETTRIIDQYAQCFFDSDVLDDKVRYL